MVTGFDPKRTRARSDAGSANGVLFAHQVLRSNTNCLTVDLKEALVPSCIAVKHAKYAY